MSDYSSRSGLSEEFNKHSNEQEERVSLLQEEQQPNNKNHPLTQSTNNNNIHYHRTAFNLLRDVKYQFYSRYSEETIQNAIAFSLNDEFSVILRNKIKHYNDGGLPPANIDSLHLVEKQLDDVKTVMVQNIEKVLERGEKIELLVNKTENLTQSSYRFETTSRNLRRAMYWRNVRRRVYICVAVVLVGWFTLLGFCGGLHLNKCR